MCGLDNTVKLHWMARSGLIVTPQASELRETF